MTDFERLSRFKEMIAKSTDDKILAVAEQLISEMIQIEDLKEKLEALEEGLTHGDKAVFWFIAESLSKESLVVAGTTIKGRRGLLKQKEDAKQKKKEREESKQKESSDEVK